MREAIRLTLLRLVGFYLRRTRAESPAGAPSRILLIRPDHLGDLLFVTPALRFLRHSLPDAYIACLVGPWGKPVLEGNPHVDRLLACPFPGFTRRPKPSPWYPYLLLVYTARRLRAQKFDSAVVMRFDHWWGAMLSAFVPIARRVGYAIPEVEPFLTHSVPYRGRAHEVVRNVRLIGELAGTDPGEIVPEKFPLEFQFSPEDAAYVDALVREGPIVAIHPGAGWPVKLWPPEKWARLADALARKGRWRVVLTGSEGEKPLVEEIAARMRARPLNLAGRTNLRQLAALWYRCELVVGSDSGPLHLAVAMGTPTVHLYGPVDPELFGPWGPEERHRVVMADMPCAPCNRLDYPPAELGSHTCVKGIEWERVWEAVETLLSDA